MATATLEESGEQRENGARKAYRLTYIIDDADDGDDADAALLAEAPSSYGGLLLMNYRTSHVGGRVWRGEAEYPTPEIAPFPANEILSFNTTGGSARIYQSLETIQSAAVGGGTPPDPKGAINQTRDGIEGVDKVASVFQFQYRTAKLASEVDLAYLRTLYLLTGRTNDDTFKGLAAGEVLYLGASGQQRPDSYFDITHNFAASANVTGLTVGGIAGINKKGWEYLWMLYEETLSESTLVRVPKAVFVERIYEAGSFGDTGLSTT